MSDVKCPRCGGTNESNAAFCGTCGTPLSLLGPSLRSRDSTRLWPRRRNQPRQGHRPPVHTGCYAPPAGRDSCAARGLSAAARRLSAHGPRRETCALVMGQNTKWAIGLGIAALFCCGPFTAIPGLFLPKRTWMNLPPGALRI